MPHDPVADAREIARNTLDLIKKRDTLAKSSSPAPDYIYEITNEKTGDSSVHIDYHKYSNFLKNHFNIIYFNKTLYIYDYGEHFYRKQTNEIETHIRDTCVKYGVKDRNVSVRSEMMSQLTSMGSYYDYPFNTSLTNIPVENGVIKIDYSTGNITMLGHGPEHLFTYKLSVKFDPSVKNCKAIPLLKRMVEREFVKTLLQIPAQAILQMQTGHAYKKAYLLQGEPHAGKTSYLKLLYMIFGDDFTTAISLQQLCNDRFVGGTLEGKLLNIYDDLEDVALDVIDQFKTLTGDCRHGIERKYETSYTGKVTAVHIFTCNYPPEYPEKVKRDAAFWTRWEYIKFPFTYSVNPNFYTEWYTEETKSAFFNMILATIIEIKKRGLISNSDSQEVMMNWSVNSDPIYEFINEYFVQGSSKSTLYLSKRKLHYEYLKWCSNSNIPEHKIKRTITSFTVALHGHSVIPEQKTERKERYEVYATTSLVIRPGINANFDYHDTLF